MGNPFRVRAAQASDVPALVRIERRCFSDPWSAESFQALLRRVGFVATRSREVVGYLFATRAGNEAEILNVAVDPEERRSGIGSALVSTVLEELDARGVRTVFLEVRASNEEARLLYGGFAFVEVGRRAGYYRRPVEDAIIMARTNPGKGVSRKSGPSRVCSVDKRT